MLISEMARPAIFTIYRKLLWIEREEQRLMNSYGKCSKEELMTLFPNRTWDAIKIKASKLKITRKIIPWTKEEEIRLLNSYKKIPKEKVLKLFPRRTWGALKSKASELNIPRKGRYFTPEEDSLLLKLRDETNLTYKQISQFFIFRDANSLRFRMDRIRHMENRAVKLDQIMEDEKLMSYREISEDRILKFQATPGSSYPGLQAR